MKQSKINKRVLTAVLSAVMVVGTVGTVWAANNVYGDDGSHIKIMTTAGETTSLPKTDFKGTNISLLPADTKIWVSSEGSTANPSTISFYVRVCPKNILTDPNQVTDMRWYAEEVYSENLEFNKQYPAFSGYDVNGNVFLAMFEDTEDGSWQRFFYLLDDGSYPTVSTVTAETTSGWKQDSTGWWYQNSDGSYPKSTWQQIDGKYYYFNEAGYMVSNTTTPDGYQVDSSGAWVEVYSASATTLPVDPENLPPHGDPIYKPDLTNPGIEEGPFGDIPGYTYVPGYGYVLNGGGGVVQGDGLPMDDNLLTGINIYDEITDPELYQEWLDFVDKYGDGLTDYEILVLWATRNNK